MTALTTLCTGFRMNSRIRTSGLQCATTYYGIARHVRFSNLMASRRLLSTSTPSDPTLRRSYLYGLLLNCFHYAPSINPSSQSPPRQIACSRSHSTSEFPQML